MQELGLDTNGQSYTGIKKQINALAHCRISLGWKTGNRIKRCIPSPLSGSRRGPTRPDDRPSYGRACSALSTPFFETMLEYAVPLDHRALSALKHSALALDVYSSLVTGWRAIYSGNSGTVAKIRSRRMKA